MVGRRPDGYHELDSLVAFADTADVIRVAPAQSLSLETEGPFAAVLGDDDDNLVLRAARALAAASGAREGAAIRLIKNLPVAAGIGGGSADAAATLRALCRLWRLDPDPDARAALALSLGADVPVCLFGRTARVQGIGERIAPAARLPRAAILLVNPGVALATGPVFAGRTGPFSAPAELPERFPDVAALARALAACRNDLAPSARQLAPQIDEVLAALAAEADCLVARLCGSGPTCFGLFERCADAQEAAGRIGARYRSWWVKAGLLLPEVPAARPVG